MPIEIKNLSIKINVANEQAAKTTAGRSKKSKALKKKSIIELVDQIHKLKNER